MTIRNQTYQHLEDPTTLFGLSFGMWALLGGTAVGSVLFGFHLSPFPTMMTIALVPFFGGLPTGLWWTYRKLGGNDRMREAALMVWRWWRGPKQLVPGGGVEGPGYVVLPAVEEHRPKALVRDTEEVRKAMEGAWDK